MGLGGKWEIEVDCVALSVPRLDDSSGIGLLVVWLHWAIITLPFVWLRAWSVELIFRKASKFQDREYADVQWKVSGHCKCEVALWYFSASEAKSQLCGVVSDAVEKLRRVRPGGGFTLKSAVDLQTPLLVEYLGQKESGLRWLSSEEKRSEST